MLKKYCKKKPQKNVINNPSQLNRTKRSHMINKFFLLLHTFFLLICLQACEKIGQKNNIIETKHLNHAIKNDVKKIAKKMKLFLMKIIELKKIDYKEDNIIIKFDNKKIVIFTNNENPILSYYKKIIK